MILERLFGKRVKAKLEEVDSLEIIALQSFNNDSTADEKRNSFSETIPPFSFTSAKKDTVPSKYLFPSVFHHHSDQIYRLEDTIIIGEYYHEGLIVPRTFSIAFNQLYNCSPLISLIQGEKDYISFLHVWAQPGDSDVVDKQVKHWMETVAEFGDITETVFAPRKNAPIGSDTNYRKAIRHITRKSQKTIVLTRNVVEIKGIANDEGVYLKGCGYHLWGS